MGGLLLVLALSILGLLGLRILDQDRRAAEDDFARDKLRAVTEVAHGLRSDLVQIGNDLELASTLVEVGLPA